LAVLTVAATLGPVPVRAADIDVTAETVAAPTVSGFGTPLATLMAPPGGLLAGIGFGDGAALCALDTLHRMPIGPRGQARFNACTAAAPPMSHRLRIEPGRAAVAVTGCLDRSETLLEGIALSTVPDFCIADPALWVERETGAPFPLRIETEDGFLRPPTSYARACSWSVHTRTVSDARSGCKRWQARSECPEGHAVAGLNLATSAGEEGMRITGLQAICRRVTLRADQDNDR
jgi:hypothetical protein